MSIIMTYTPLSKEQREKFEKSQQEFYDKYMKNRDKNRKENKIWLKVFVVAASAGFGVAKSLV